MNFRRATLNDCNRLAELNHQLIRDEGHRNPMTVPELEQRLRGWLAGEYAALIFEDDGEVVSVRAVSRGAGGTLPAATLCHAQSPSDKELAGKAIEILRTQIWPKRTSV